MGLDMYLKAEWYLSQFDETEKKIAESVSEIVGLEKMPGRKNVGKNVVESEAIYWRKANAIHKWFVDNVQDGVDDCGNYDVGIEQLQELAETCRKVLNDKSLASELLPAQSGFFFGGTDYDEWYFKDLEYTATEIEKLLSIEKQKLEGIEYYPWTFVYHSSW
jgi:hypothetical protein